MNRDFVLALDEIWVRGADDDGRSFAVQAASAAELERVVAEVAVASRQQAFPVLYERGAPRNDFTRRLVTPAVAIKLAPAADPAALASSVGALSFSLPAHAPGHAILQTAGGLASLRAASSLAGAGGVELAEPQLARLQAKKVMPDDPLINDQWHLKFNNQAGALAGTDLNIEAAWAYPTPGAGRRGRGIRIGIVDDGLQTNHPDLAANVDTVNDKDWNGNDGDPSPGKRDDHGTACAGDAAAVGNNSLGVAGSAPEATLVGMRLISSGSTDAQEAEAMGYLPQLIQIKSNSWGPSDTGTILEAPGSLTKAALKNAAETGRAGLGTIFLWAGGNGLQSKDNANCDGYANSIYTIAVGAMDSLARQAYYSEPGANLVIVAPSSGSSPALGKTTTDRTGSAGYSSGDYADDFGGTSSATPTAAGVVALVLEANPGLGWRDVQEILMRSAKKVNPTDTDWAVTSAGINHNHKFGAGLIDATAAVTMAAGWTNLPAQLKRTVTQTGINVAIPNQDPAGISREFVIAPADNLRTEHVTVTVNINHTARGNLRVWLTSPSGVVSRLAEVHSDSGDNFPNWTFMSVRHWGDSAAGTWRLDIADESGTGNSTGGTLTSATLDIFGSAPPPVNPAPAVSLTSPTFPLVTSPGGVVQLAATATDLTASGAPGSVASVEFLADGNVIHTATLPPYVFSWSPAAGVYAVSARATDTEGASATTPMVLVDVHEPSYAEWIAKFPGLADTSPGGDPEHDGTPNVAEYFMGLDPSLYDACVGATFEGGVLSLEYRRSKHTQGVTGTVKSSPRLSYSVPWATNGVVDQFLSDQGTYEMRRATITVPPEEGKRFLRLDVTQP